MDPRCDFHSWSKVYRQDVLRQARKRDLLAHADGKRASRAATQRLRLAWTSLLSALGAARLQER